MKPKFNRSGISFVSVAFLTVYPLQAADYYWDANGATAGTGGTGNWTTTGSLWRADSAAGALGSWANNNSAMLGGTYGTLTTTAAIQANQINVLAGVTGTAPFSIANGTGGSLTFSGSNKTVGVAAGTSLQIAGRIPETSGEGETSLLTVQGGGTLTMTGVNRAYGGNMRVTGAGTRLVMSGGNSLNIGSASGGLPAGTIGITAADGGTFVLGGATNHTAAMVLSAGTLEISNSGNGLVMQNNSVITVNGSAMSRIIGDAGAGNTAKVLANAAARVINVGATGDPSGYDLEVSANSGTMGLVGNGSGNGSIQKNGAGVMRILPGTYVSSNQNGSFDAAKVSLIVNGGTFHNEGIVNSITQINNGAIARTGPAAGTYDAVIVNAGGIFEISKTNSFAPGIPFTGGQKSLTLDGGTLRFSGFNSDVSASISQLTIKAVIDTNGQNVSFATGLTGAGGLTKSGAGILTLGTANSYTGTTTVAAGTLALGAAGSVASSVDVRDGATLDVTALAGGPAISSGNALTGTGTSLVTGNLNLPAGTTLRPGGIHANGTTAITGNLTLAGTYEADLDPLGNDLVTVSGNANLAGSNILPVTQTTFTPQAYTLLNYDTLSGSPVLDSDFVASRYGPVLDLGPQNSPGSITLTITGTLADLVWTGEQNNIWTAEGPLNWNNSGTDDVFKPFDSVTFDDTAGSFDLSISGSVIPASMNFFNGSNNYRFTGTGSIDGTGGIYKAGAGSLILATDNTFSGDIVNEAGILQIGEGGSAGSIGGGAITNSGQLVFNIGADLTAFNTISGFGSLEKRGTGKLTLISDNNTYSGTTAINGGTLSIASDSQLGTAGVGQLLTINGTLEITGATTLATNRAILLGPAAGAGNGTIDVATTDADIVAYSGVMMDNDAGTGGLVKTGPGILDLDTDHTYSGPTSVLAGAVRFRSEAAFGTSAAGTTVASGAWIYLLGGANHSAIEEPLTISGNGAGNGAIRAGTGNARFTLAGPVTLAADARIYVDANSAMDFTNTVAGSNTSLSFQNGSLTCTFGGSLSLGTGSFTKTGAGTTILAADNSYGATIVSANILRIGEGGTTGTPGSGPITNDGTLVFDRGNLLTVSNEISGSGTVNKAGGGTTIFSGTNSYSGNTNINAGTLQLDGDHAAGGNYIVASGATLSGGGITSSAVVVNGSLSPGASIGTLTTGPVTLNNNSALVLDINTDTVTADKLVVEGDVDRAGANSDIILTDIGEDTVLAVGTKFTLVEYTGTWDPADELRYLGTPVPDLTEITLGSNTFVLRYDDNNALTLTVGTAGTPFDAWIAGYETELPNVADRLPGADPDNDGANNLAEFALNGDPASGANNGLVAVVLQDTDQPADTRELTLVAAVRRGVNFAPDANNARTGSADGVIYTVQGSLALAAWDSAVTALATASDTAPAGSGLAADLTGTGWEYRTFTLDASEGLGGRGFLRIMTAE